MNPLYKFTTYLKTSIEELEYENTKDETVESIDFYLKRINSL